MGTKEQLLKAFGRDRDYSGGMNIRVKGERGVGKFDVSGCGGEVLELHECEGMYLDATGISPKGVYIQDSFFHVRAEIEAELPTKEIKVEGSRITELEVDVERKKDGIFSSIGSFHKCLYFEGEGWTAELYSTGIEGVAEIRSRELRLENPLNPFKTINSLKFYGKKLWVEEGSINYLYLGDSNLREVYLGEDVVIGFLDASGKRLTSLEKVEIDGTSIYHADLSGGRHPQALEDALRDHARNIDLSRSQVF